MSPDLQLFDFTVVKDESKGGQVRIHLQMEELAHTDIIECDNIILLED